jgi:hypothetical protein
MEETMANDGFLFDLHANNSAQVDSAQKIEIPVLGPGAVNLLVIYTGTAILNWTLPDEPEDPGTPPHIANMRIVLEEDFDSQYGIPPELNLFPAPTFLAVSSEASRTTGLEDPDNDEWDFEILPFSVDQQFTGLSAPQLGQRTSLQITARVTNDERGTFGRIAYQASVAVVAKAPPAQLSGGCNDLESYQHPPNQPPFNLLLFDSQPFTLGAKALEFIIDPPAANGANRLLMFTGEAVVDFTPSNDDQLTKGTVTIQFVSHDLVTKDNLKSATGSATLNSIFNNDTGFDTTYAVDCVQVTAEQNGHLVVPTLTAAVAVQGKAAGPGGAGMSNLSYQANVEIAVGLQILVNSDLASPNFVPTVTVFAGQQWDLQITLSTQGPATVQLTSDQPQIVPDLPPFVVIPPGTAIQIIRRLSTSTIPGTQNVNITASLGTSSSTATLVVVQGR